uniref:Uncharacterized protein n=1 Tax=Anopheles coluzzii TaxID=1518534 RepID=A0A8W7P1U9_ANOCL
MMMGMMVMVWTSTRSSSCSRPACRIADTVVLARSRQQPVVWWLRRHIGTGMVLLQVVERLGRTALGRRLLGLAARMVRGLMMRLMVRLMMWWRWLMVLGVLLLLLLGRLRITIRLHCTAGRAVATDGRSKQQLLLLSPTEAAAAGEAETIIARRHHSSYDGDEEKEADDDVEDVDDEGDDGGAEQYGGR